MKRIHIDTEAFALNLPTPSPTFAAETMAQLRALAAKKEEIPMKRKPLTCILIAAMLLVLLAATALAAYTLTRSPEADAISKARKALAADYGLTSETIGLFYAESIQQGDTWTVTFHADGFNPTLLGGYTVTLTPGKDPETSWTYDDVDPATWKDGSLEAPVWGQPQMLKALKDKKAAEAVLARIEWPTAVPRPSVQQTPIPLKEGESRLNGEILHKATPGPKDITEDQALDLAMQALMEEAPFTKEVLDTADVMAEFYESNTGNSIWSFQIYVVDGGIEQLCGVVLDARTGEILRTAVTTGGNG
jgi:hypothetical protein